MDRGVPSVLVPASRVGELAGAYRQTQVGELPATPSAGLDDAPMSFVAYPLETSDKESLQSSDRPGMYLEPGTD